MMKMEIIITEEAKETIEKVVVHWGLTIAVFWNKKNIFQNLICAFNSNSGEYMTWVCDISTIDYKTLTCLSCLCVILALNELYAWPWNLRMWLIFEQTIIFE